MTDDNKLSLSRRKALIGLGTIGAAGAGAGMGTSALFSDEESFTNNSIEAGELDLIVDYETSVDQDGVDTGSTTGGSSAFGGPARINGNPASGEYVIKDLKPGDSGQLIFCPKIVDNPGWLWVGSVDGLTGFENGQTEPEEDVDATGGDLGEGRGELADEIQVTVSYIDAPTPGAKRELNNPDDYTLADLFKDLESGFLVDGEPFSDDPDGTQAYPSSPNDETQNGPCLLIEWEVPTSVGNEIQSDSIEFDVTFAAYQERNNPDPENPFVDAVVTSGGSIQDAIDAAAAGDVIRVEPGTYDEKVTVNTADVLLYSSDPTATTISDQVIVTADGVTLCGFTVSPPAATSTGESEAIRVSNSPDGVTIVNNIVENFERDVDDADDGFWGTDGINAFGGSSGDPIKNVTIRDNTIRNVYNADKFGSTGISIQGNVDGATVKDNTIMEIGVDTSGTPVNSYAFGVVIRATGSLNPKNINVVDNDISSVLASGSTEFLGVGFGVESDGTNYLARDNTIDDINIGVELKAAATELTLTGNSISNIDNSVNNANNPGVPPLYLGDKTGNAPIGMFIADNSYDVAVTSGGSCPVGYQQTIVPQ